MAIDPRTPVLVGAAAVQQRRDDPTTALDAVGLMVEALRRAAEDAGAPALLARAASVRVPRGLWDYPDPARLVAERVGATAARTEVAEIGVLQTTLLGRAADAIARGAEDVVLIAGGEAKYRDGLAARRGVVAPRTPQAPTEPDEVLRPHAEIVCDAELAHGLAMPVTQYALLENALRAADGMSVAEHRAVIDALWAAQSRVAAENPAAWDRTAYTAVELAAPSDRNRPLAFPYTTRHTSQWNVDQAAGVILCAAETARRAGIPESRWVFPLAVADSNHMVPVAARPALAHSPGFRIAGERLTELAGIAPREVEHRELYSCFPIAVRMQQRELGIALEAPATVTGGMAFAGGPLNNFVLQALAKMVEVLRADPGSRGLVTAVSGMLTKQGLSLWSTEPPARPWRFEDVTDRVAAEVVPRAVVREHQGAATVASYTVLCERGAPQRAVAVCDLPDGRRTVASTTDPAAVGAVLEGEGCGRPVRIAGGLLTL